MISENIKKLRNEKGFTQKALADELHVTSQAISRWEKAEVEPSIDTLKNMAKIFEVSLDELVGGPENNPEKEVIIKTEKEYVVKESQPVLAVCEKCNKPIYDGNEIVRQGKGGRRDIIICKSCDNIQKDNEYKQAVETGLKRRKNSYIWSSIIAISVLLISLLSIKSLGYSVGNIALVVFGGILSFTFAACMFLQNNFIEDTFLSIASWGFVKFPGLIFSFDLDGFIWLIGMKILFWLLGFALGCASVILALCICLPLSVIVYPFALHKNYQNPEYDE